MTTATGSTVHSPQPEATLGVWSGLVAGLLSAALFTLAWPPFGVWPLVLVAPAPLAWWSRRASRGRVAFLVGVVTQWPAWAVLEWWTAELTGPGFVALCCLCACYGGLFACLFRRVSRSRRWGAWPAAITLPIVWCAVEYLRTSIILGGYPWFQLGIPLVGSPQSTGLLAQSASIVGSHGLSTIAAMTAGAVVDLARWQHRPHAATWSAVSLAGLVLAANAAYGAWVIGSREVLPGPRLLVVQTNLATSNKIAWSREAQQRDFVSFAQDTVAAFAKAASAGERPDLVVWPETMVPGVGLEPQAIDFCVGAGLYPGNAYAEALVDLHERLAVPLLVGSPSYLGLRVEGERFAWDRHFNSVYLIDGEPPHERYDKLFLTPFGEEMPVISRFDWLEAKLLAIGAPGMAFNLDAGEAPVRFAIPVGAGATPPRSVRVATPICFEDTVGSVCRTLVYDRGTKVVDVLVNPSNDGWFGSSQGGREQHVLHARLRSIELSIPMVRAANTGLSVTIDDLGRVVDWIGRARGAAAPGRGTISGTLLTSVEISQRTTIFGRIGDVWSMVMLVVGALVTLTARPAVRTSAARN